jgi:hypothetical protein
MKVFPIKIKSYKQLISVIGIAGLNKLKTDCEEINREHNLNLYSPSSYSFNYSIKVYKFPTLFSIQVENAIEIWFLIIK